ncbi:MAG: TetR/AcrR family transcriptional regulator [Anaerolineae bacterium]|nr:TetR/AcrR family transcriptional regulator [Anaerolineae bacterium]
MTRTLNRRQQRHQATIQEIKDTARQQMAEEGVSNLSLGAIARAIGMTPPALYRYFESRGALVTALVVDAYDSMGEALEQSQGSLSQDDYAGRFLALMHAYRGWALKHPADYALMYGTPAASVDLSGEQERFQRAVMRSMRAMVEVLHAAYDAKCLTIPSQYQEPPPTVRTALTWMQSVLPDKAVPLGVLALAFTTWLRADGLIWQELHGHLPKDLFGYGELYEMESRVLAERLGLVAL